MSDAPHVDPSSDEPTVSLAREAERTAALALPWAVSLLMHLGIGLFAVFVVWSAAIEEEPEANIVATIQRFDQKPTVDITYTSELELDMPAQTPRDVQTEDVADGDPLSELTQSTATDIKLIGATGQDKPLPAGGLDDGPGGKIFVPPSDGVRARTIVYIVDASGSMADSLPFVLDELKASLRRLGPDQSFSVIFFQRGEAIEVPPRRRLNRATQTHVKHVADWISLSAGHVIPRGATNPVDALKV